jgi:hypothetical protein
MKDGKEKILYPIPEKRKLPFAFTIGIALFLFCSLAGVIFASFPDPVTINRFITVFSLSAVVGFFGGWNTYNPHWAAVLLCGLGLTGLMLAWAIHNLMFGIIGINNWVWLLPLVATYVMVWILPVVFPSLAFLISNEQTNPKTRLGRGCLVISLSVGGAAGAVGAAIARFIDHTYGFQTAFLILGIGVSVITIALSQSMACQAFAKRSKKSLR